MESFTFKISLLICLLVGVLGDSNSQNCFESISEISGFNATPYHVELETAACALKEAFPVEFQDEFKVYDFGFYSLNENMNGGFEAVWDKVVDDVQSQSPYYLLFGKQSDITGVYAEFWVDIVLPKSGDFECLDLFSESIRTDIVTKFRIRANFANESYGKEAHHLIPWALKDHPIMGVLAKKGWHMSNPVKNGIPIPQALHGNHPSVNNGVRDILNRLATNGKISDSMGKTEVLQRMKKLTDKLSDEVGVAITSNTSISEHFKNVDWNSIYNHTVN